MIKEVKLVLVAKVFRMVRVVSTENKHPEDDLRGLNHLIIRKIWMSDLRHTDSSMKAENFALFG